MAGMTDTLALERVAGNFAFPTSLAFAPDGTPFVAEAGLPLGGARSGGRVWKVVHDGSRALIVDDLPPPVTGLTYADGSLWVSADGQIRRVELSGLTRIVVDGLPSGGNYHTNMAVLGHDGWLYFSQGGMTNSGIVGLDGYDVAWLGRVPHPCDIPGFTIVLDGFDVETPDPRALDAGATTRTGAFVPFGTAAQPGRWIRGTVPCTASIMRCRADGTELELVAWGLRNAFGLGFLPDGCLLAIDQGADDRGSRPIGNAPDLLYEIVSGAWYGWPDFIAGEPVTHPRYRPARGPPPRMLIANHTELPRPRSALYRFDTHVAATNFAVGAPANGAWDGALAVAMFGDEQPMTAPPGDRTGRGVLRLDLAAGTAQRLADARLIRPIDVAFEPRSGALYVLDFGHFEMGDKGRVDAQPGSGALWRLSA
jgi:glucose/arabinose dehydrogenase